MQFPVEIKFIAGVGTLRLLVTDAIGKVSGCLAGVSGFLRAIVYTDPRQEKALYTIEWTYRDPEYCFATIGGEQLGAMKRTPWRSVWRAHYVIRTAGTPVLEIIEENPWIKVIDTVAGVLPVIDRLTGLFLNPTYAVMRADGTPLLRLKKERAIRELYFSVHQTGPVEPRERELALLALLMFVMRENTRG